MKAYRSSLQVLETSQGELCSIFLLVSATVTGCWDRITVLHISMLENSHASCVLDSRHGGWREQLDDYTSCVMDR